MKCSSHTQISFSQPIISNQIVPLLMVGVCVSAREEEVRTGSGSDRVFDPASLMNIGTDPVATRSRPTHAYPMACPVIDLMAYPVATARGTDFMSGPASGSRFGGGIGRRTVPA
jgi:hypothetical protein